MQFIICPIASNVPAAVWLRPRTEKLTTVIRADSIPARARRVLRGLRRSIRRAASGATLGAGLLVMTAARPQAAALRAHGDGSARAFAAQRDRSVSLQQAIAMALSRYPGRVVRAQTKSRGDRIVHEIRIISDRGHVRTVQVDAKTGQFL